MSDLLSMTPELLARMKLGGATLNSIALQSRASRYLVMCTRSKLEVTDDTNKDLHYEDLRRCCESGLRLHSVSVFTRSHGDVLRKLANALTGNGGTLKCLTCFTVMDMDLTPLAHPPWTSLEDLSLVGRIHSVDLELVAALPSIRVLHLNLASSRNVPYLGPLAHMSSLRCLSIAFLPLEQVGFQAVAGLTGLTSLSLHGQEYGNDPLPDLHALTSLTTLFVVDMCLKDGLLSISSLTKLRELRLKRLRGVSSLEPVTVLTDLRDLDVCGLPVDDLAPLARLPMLRTLRIDGLYTLSDLTPLENMTQLQHLCLHGLYKVRDLSSLRSLSCNLQYLEMSWMMTLSCLDPLTALSSLRSLHIDTASTRTEGAQPIDDPGLVAFLMSKGVCASDINRPIQSMIRGLR